MEVTLHRGVSEFTKAEWKALESPNYPFTDYEHYVALEASGCVGAEAGWLPLVLALRTRAGGLCGAMVLYLKDNSYGEFIFDHPWAAAFQRAGIPYFPKMVCSIPFTPATGPRILSSLDASAPEVHARLSERALQLARELRCSSLHVLFIPPEDRPRFTELGMLLRDSTQYHWHNRRYMNFEEFTASLTGKRRRQVQQERRQVQDLGLSFTLVTGTELKQEYADLMHELYCGTHDKRSSPTALNREFFRQVFKTMPRQTFLHLAWRDDKPIAGAVNFGKGAHMYGRYWGAREEVRHLHFELCYYRPIEHAIANGIVLYEAGAQGEHKVPRGFVPTLTHSAHELFHPGFRAAIGSWLEHEREAVKEELAAWEPHLPYKQPLHEAPLP